MSCTPLGRRGALEVVRTRGIETTSGRQRTRGSPLESTRPGAQPPSMTSSRGTCEISAHPCYGRNFFETIVEELGSAATVVVVRLERKAGRRRDPPHHRGTVEIPWASSLRRYNTLCPNYSSTGSSHACDRGRRATFDFARRPRARGRIDSRHSGEPSRARSTGNTGWPPGPGPDLNPEGGRSSSRCACGAGSSGPHPGDRPTDRQIHPLTVACRIACTRAALGFDG